MKQLVSILIPAFKAQEWIAETVKSAINQTWQRKEIIVVDDGSPDETLSIVRKFASKNLEVCTQENQGAAAARNKALSLCQGDYIQWLDADDLLAPDKIARQMAILEGCQDSRLLLSSAWGRFNHRAKRATFIPTSLWCDLTPAEWLIRKIGENLFMQTAAWLVSRELSEAADPWDTRMISDDDGEYFARVIVASSFVRFVPDARSYYRIRPSNRLSYIGHSDKKKDALFLSMQLHVKYLRSLEDSDRVRGACLTFLQNLMFNFYPERPDIVKELEKLAGELGGRLDPPRLRGKYAWIKPLFGWSSAKRAQLFLPNFKASLMRSWDWGMHNLESRGRGNPREGRPSSRELRNSPIDINKLTGQS
jgi:glycosyltransferase involved in cell wall biosynthesis